MISNIKRGSVAHRCGTLNVGDRLLAIDGLPLSGRMLQEAASVLQACGEIVTLLVLKEDAPSGETERNSNEGIQMTKCLFARRFPFRYISPS